MEGHPVVAPNGAARVSKRFRNSTEPRGHGTKSLTAWFGAFAGNHSRPKGHPVVAPNGAARVSKRSCDGTEPRGHGTRWHWA
jgi:hypothetical protein